MKQLWHLFDGDASVARHIAVTHKGLWYSLKTWSDTGVPYSSAQIARALHGLFLSSAGVNASTSSSSDDHTSIDWTKKREAIIALSPTNATSVQAIDKSAFVVSIDDVASNVRKSLQLRLHTDANAQPRAAVVINSLRVDASTALYALEQAFGADGESDERVDASRSDELQELPITMPVVKPARRRASSAASKHSDTSADGETRGLFVPLDESELGNMNTHADGWLHLAVQLAYMQSNSRPANVCAWMSMRVFASGRDALWRPFTAEAYQW
jgi:hypothetical protein